MGTGITVKMQTMRQPLADEHDTIESYIIRKINAAKELSDNEKPGSPAFFYYQGQINSLYMMLTGWNNPISNPREISKQVSHNKKQS